MKKATRPTKRVQRDTGGSGRGYLPLWRDWAVGQSSTAKRAGSRRKEQASCKWKRWQQNWCPAVLRAWITGWKHRSPPTSPVSICHSPDVGLGICIRAKATNFKPMASRGFLHVVRQQAQEKDFHSPGYCTFSSSILLHTWGSKFNSLWGPLLNTNRSGKNIVQWTENLITSFLTSLLHKVNGKIMQ